jgi:hypothetical protein
MVGSFEDAGSEDGQEGKLVGWWALLMRLKTTTTRF